MFKDMFDILTFPIKSTYEYGVKPLVEPTVDTVKQMYKYSPEKQVLDAIKELIEDLKKL